MNPLNLVRRTMRFGSHLYGLAGTREERISLALFSLRFAVSRLAPRLAGRADAVLRLNGTHYVMGPWTTEIFSLDELYYHHDYDKVDDFIARQGWIVLDIGANVGVFTREQVRRGARVYAFEPNPDCYRRLDQMIDRNHLKDHIEAHNLALAAVSGEGTMRVQRGWTTSGSIVSDNGGSSSTGPRVAIKTLDSITPALCVTSIDLLKIDVEGAEAEVLRGASCTLRKVDRVVVEYHSRVLREQVDAILTDAGFSRVLCSDENPRIGVGVAYYAARSRLSVAV